MPSMAQPTLGASSAVADSRRGSCSSPVLRPVLSLFLCVSKNGKVYSIAAYRWLTLPDKRRIIVNTMETKSAAGNTQGGTVRGERKRI